MSNTEEVASRVKCWAAGLHKHRADLKNTIEALRKTQAKKASTAERDSLRTLLHKKPKKGHQVIFGRKSESKMNALLVPDKGLISWDEDIINVVEDYFQQQATPVLPKQENSYHMTTPVPIHGHVVPRTCRNLSPSLDPWKPTQKDLLSCL
jgi:hypothetical protein